MMSEPSRESIDATPGVTILEFGATWCGFCQGARPLIDRALAEHPGVRHVWIEDGKGKRLGRSFGVTLWPTVIVMRDGIEIARVVRPAHFDALRTAFVGVSSIAPSGR